ncbi:MAG: hypothetical protein EPN37_12950 [Chitinophagaceae bacterium]|nr:MAG: hypothetical protein EPN37_12950 [Chitinophagaceae bacterium]
MKRNKLMLPILAVIVGVAASAFTVRPETVSSKNLTTEYWFSNFPGPLQYDGIQTKSSEESITGCTDVTTTCARGYVSSQLKDPNNPAAGPANINDYTENLNHSN